MCWLHECLIDFFIVKKGVKSYVLTTKFLTVTNIKGAHLEKNFKHRKCVESYVLATRSISILYSIIIFLCISSLQGLSFYFHFYNPQLIVNLIPVPEN